MTTPRRRTARRSLLVLLLLGAAAALTAVTIPRSAPVAAGTLTSGALSQVADASDPAEGREVYLRDCAWCHGTDGEGSQLAPTLEESGAAEADFYLRTGRMPLDDPGDRVEAGKPRYDDRTTDSLVAYVATLGEGLPVPTVEPGDAVEGRSIFLSSCAPCHSSSGTGMILSGGEWAPELFDTPPTQVAEAVRIGPGPMPAFEEPHLTDSQLNDVVTYVQQLGPKQVESGNGLDQFGPIAEGLFVWLGIVPLLLVVLVLLGKRAKR